ncbi:Diaminopimelate epimerase-like protein [Ramicandelaber brevisporus]|nr:Diaminopimelate epimerase-like protein [Ramicandelaber brevisporus]
MTNIRLFTVDAFAAAPFAGGAAGVCLVPAAAAPALDAARMQQIASELNLPATAFVASLDENEGEQGEFAAGSRFGLRWFTPHREIKLCGHGTIASAHVLINELGNPSEQIEFVTQSGDVLKCEKSGVDPVTSKALVSIELPTMAAQPVSLHTDENDRKEIINIAKAFLGPATSTNVQEDDIWLESKLGKLVIFLNGGHDSVAKLAPLPAPEFRQDPSIAEAAQRLGIHTISITTDGSGSSFALSPGVAEADFVSRMIYPFSGDEDPVTGSLHCVVAPIWSAKLGGKTQLHAVQASSRRGELLCELINDGTRLKISGGTRTIIRGSLSF